MENYKVTSLNVSFQTSGIPAVPEKPDAPTLSSLWSRTDAIKRDASGNFLHMRVNAASRPVTLLDGDGWLGSVYPAGDNKWEVTVWRNQLSNPRLFPDKEDRAAALEMLSVTENLRPDTWSNPGFVPMSKPEEFKLQPLG